MSTKISGWKLEKGFVGTWCGPAVRPLERPDAPALRLGKYQSVGILSKENLHMQSIAQVTKYPGKQNNFCRLLVEALVLALARDDPSWRGSLDRLRAAVMS